MLMKELENKIEVEKAEKLINQIICNHCYYRINYIDSIPE